MYKRLYVYHVHIHFDPCTRCIDIWVYHVRIHLAHDMEYKITCHFHECTLLSHRIPRIYSFVVGGGIPARRHNLHILLYVDCVRTFRNHHISHNEILFFDANRCFHPRTRYNGYVVCCVGILMLRDILRIGFWFFDEYTRRTHCSPYKCILHDCEYKMTLHCSLGIEKSIFHVRTSYGYILVYLQPSLTIRMRCDSSSNL